MRAPDHGRRGCGDAGAAIGEEAHGAGHRHAGAAGMRLFPLATGDLGTTRRHGGQEHTITESNRETNGYGTTGAGSTYGATGGSGTGTGTYGTGGTYGGSGYDAADTRERGGGLSGEMRNLIADVEDLLKGVANIGDADVARLRERVNETLRSTKEQLRERTETLRAQASDAATTADAYVRERPWAAIGIATAIGVAIGLWAGRRGGDDY